MRIEADRLRVLLVDGELTDSIMADSVFQKLPAKPGAALLRGEEQHLKPPVLRSQKGGGPARHTLGDGKMGDAVQRLRHVGFAFCDFRVRQKQMRCTDGGFPKRQKRGQQG